MAAITSYATLQTEVAAWLHRTDLTSDIKGWITLGEYRIYRDLRVRQMETALSSTISSGVIAVPSGYVELKNAYVNSSPNRSLTKKDAEWIYYNYPTRSSDGTPAYIAREGSNFIFGPYPDSNYTIKGIYYKRLDALSDSNTSNWLITDAPDLILFATLCEAAPWLVDDARTAIWEKKYAQIKDRVQKQDNDEEFSGSPLSITAR
jgi:hypothetical protein